MKCLFIQGDIKLGKSTMIRNSLLSYEKYLGGFLVQRIMDNNTAAGFKLCEVDAIYPPLCVSYKKNLRNVFINLHAKVYNLDIFKNEGFKILNSYKLKDKKLIVLDEIGGIELLSDKFNNELYNVLENYICIGVFKALTNLKNMKNNLKDDVLIKKNQLLYYDIENLFSGKIMTLTNENRSFVQNEIDKFIKELF